MKKFITLLIIPIYVVLSSGVNILTHTCGGETSAYFMPISTKDPCQEGEMPGCFCSSSCCNMELKVFKVSEYQMATVILTHIQHDSINPLFISDKNLYNITHFKYSNYFAKDLSPPLKIPINLFDCTLLI